MTGQHDGEDGAFGQVATGRNRPVGRRVWFDRRFAPGTPPEAFPDLVERLRGTPARLAERTSGVPLPALRARVGESWSIQEHAGHLADLEPLWLGRLDDLEARVETLRPADLKNRATWDADHNARALGDVLGEFRSLRERLVSRLESLGEADLRVAAAHPRLGQPMTVVDLCFFVAEHDDHHLAAITALRRARGSG
jgi:uncharacterized damage-inducible protein DinB